MSQDTRLSITSRSFLRQAWALARPYWFSEERWAARGLLAAVVILNLGMVYLTVRFNRWHNDFFNALQNKDAEQFWRQLVIWSVIAAIFIVVAIYQFKLNWLLQIRWRRWLTDVYFKEWLSDRVYYRMELRNYGTDNPDQRIQEDLRLFTTNTIFLSLGLLREVVSLASFVVILWTLSGALTLPLAGASIVIPGYMVWVALLYAAAGTWVAHWIGRPLVRLSFDQQRYEADLRYSMTRIRENAEGVALYKGEREENDTLRSRFANVWDNWLSIITYRKRLGGYTAFYSQLAAIFPYVVVAPRYFSGALQLGGVMQTANAFGYVQSALSWFIDAYAQLAEWKATVDRLTGFHLAITAAGTESKSGAAIKVTANDNTGIAARDLTVRLPDGRVLLREVNTAFDAGEHTLITGPSGSGKSTLFRAIAGIWPFGTGNVETPAQSKVLFLPQKPYLPLGSLRAVVAYPADAGRFSDARIAETLRLCRLEQFADRLDEHDNWAMRMSPGEQQRLAIARALLNSPDWLFLDEATAALDEKTEQHLYALLRARLPQTTFISIAHRPQIAVQHRRRLELVAGADGTRLLETAFSPA
ncbi:MAG: ABC transporter ATP-binding protein/permease [Chromatiales bacterium]